MSYNTLPQTDHDEDRRSPNRPDGHVSPPETGNLFLDNSHDSSTSSNNLHSRASSSNGIENLLDSITSTRTNAKYGLLEEDDFAIDAPSSPTFVNAVPKPQDNFVHRPLPRQRRPRSPATSKPPSRKGVPLLRSASAHRLALQHPTPDLQTLQGAYVGNIEQLERSAERLSMTSSIEDAIKELHDEQKRSDSRRSSLLESQGMAQISRQVSNASSIVEVNSAARSGGFSPAGFIMSPGGSFSANSSRGRSASKSSKFGTRAEPEFEGRPLDAFVSPTSPTFPSAARSASLAEASPRLLRTDSIPEQDEESPSHVQPMLQPTASPIMEHEHEVPFEQEKLRDPSIYTVEQTPSMFEGFDGVHGEHGEPRRSFSEQHSNVSDDTQRRPSPASRLPLLDRPKSYADPLTGQQMVYYPAPVPMMLNLPQKLSKNPSPMARNKRRTQVMSTVPAAARKSAVWLPDVLDSEHQEIDPNDSTQDLEYIPQHQRATMGGRRNTQDLSHMPAHLRANTFFDLPAHEQTVEVKDQSPMATLDSILDASAFAPVNAFTDHAFAGALGAEVYGKEKRQSKSVTNLLDVPTKRQSTLANLLNRRSASSANLLDNDDRRRSTMPGLTEGTHRRPIDSDSEDDDDNGDIIRNSDGEDDDDQENTYHGPPTTLLAELQLRKQQQKQRTRPLTTAFPNGVHSTLLELDAVAQVEAKTRKGKRVNLAWEDPTLDEVAAAENDDDDVPLGLLYSKHTEDLNRPLGLMERREIEDNEPLSARRSRLLGVAPLKQGMRSSTMMNLATHVDDNDDEPLAQRIARMKGAHQSSANLPNARPVSGDFASEMMSQLGAEGLIKELPVHTGTPVGEEEETLGQRKKRLQAERDARATEVGQNLQPENMRPGLRQRHSMANILHAHPAAGSSERLLSYQKPSSGLLHLHEQEKNKRASTMIGLNTQQQQRPQQRVVSGMSQQPRIASYNSQFMGGSVPQFAQPTINNAYGIPMNYSYGNGMYPQQQQMMFNNPYAMQPGYNMMDYGGNVGYMNGMAMGMNAPMHSPQQVDMVERWRQGIRQ